MSEINVTQTLVEEVRTWRKPHTPQEEQSASWKAKDQALIAAYVAVSETAEVKPVDIPQICDTAKTVA